jgi:hypothetical protein
MHHRPPLFPSRSKKQVWPPVTPASGRREGPDDEDSCSARVSQPRRANSAWGRRPACRPREPTPCGAGVPPAISPGRARLPPSRNPPPLSHWKRAGVRVSLGADPHCHQPSRHIFSPVHGAIVSRPAVDGGPDRAKGHEWPSSPPPGFHHLARVAWWRRIRHAT